MHPKKITCHKLQLAFYIIQNPLSGNFILKCMGQMEVKIESSWKEVLKDEFKKPYFKQIAEHLRTEKSQGKTICHH